MDDDLVATFIRETLLQCEYALKAYDDFSLALQFYRSGDSTELVFYHIQTFLITAAMVSKLLWPPQSNRRARGVRLRTELGLRGDLTVRTREFRDHIEHFDERLHDYEKPQHPELGGPLYLDLVVSPTSDIPSYQTWEKHRFLHSESRKFHFYGKALPLADVASELEEIRGKCHDWLVSHHPPPDESY